MALINVLVRPLYHRKVDGTRVEALLGGYQTIIYIDAEAGPGRCLWTDQRWWQDF